MLGRLADTGNTIIVIEHDMAFVRQIARRVTVLHFGRVDPRQIVEWILADNLNVRFQLQMHKFIWMPTQRGV